MNNTAPLAGLISPHSAEGFLFPPPRQMAVSYLLDSHLPPRVRSRGFFEPIP